MISKMKKMKIKKKKSKSEQLGKISSKAREAEKKESEQESADRDKKANPLTAKNIEKFNKITSQHSGKDDESNKGTSNILS